MSRRILLLHSSIRWILSCSSQTSLKRVLVASVGMMFSALLRVTATLATLNFL